MRGARRASPEAAVPGRLIPTLLPAARLGDSGVRECSAEQGDRAMCRPACSADCLSTLPRRPSPRTVPRLRLSQAKLSRRRPAPSGSGSRHLLLHAPALLLHAPSGAPLPLAGLIHSIHSRQTRAAPSSLRSGHRCPAVTAQHSAPAWRDARQHDVTVARRRSSGRWRVQSVSWWQTRATAAHAEAMHSAQRWPMDRWAPGAFVYAIRRCLLAVQIALPWRCEACGLRPTAAVIGSLEAVRTRCSGRHASISGCADAPARYRGVLSFALLLTH